MLQVLSPVNIYNLATIVLPSNLKQRYNDIFKKSPGLKISFMEKKLYFFQDPIIQMK